MLHAEMTPAEQGIAAAQEIGNRGYIHLKEAWYAEACLQGREFADQVTFGPIINDGESVADIQITWYPLNNRLAPRLEAFDDTWVALVECSDILGAMTHTTDITAENFCHLLDLYGFTDMTPRKKGARQS